MGGTFWRSGICCIDKGRWLLRGYDITQLMGRVSYGALVYLMLKGELPSRKIGKLMDAILISMCDYGPLAPSVAACRYAASGGVDLPAAIASGLLGIGDAHGGTISGAMEVFYNGVKTAKSSGRTLEEVAEEIVGEFKARKRFIPGYGRPSGLEEADPNTVAIRRLDELARRTGTYGEYVELSKAIEKAIKTTVLNLDGANGAILCELGFEPRLGRAIFCVSRIIGLAAEAYEELTRERPFRQTPYNDITYDGPKMRKLPTEYDEELV